MECPIHHLIFFLLEFLRYNVSCSKKFALSRWNRKPDNQSLGHRGRRPSGPDGAAREHILRQVCRNFDSMYNTLFRNTRKVQCCILPVLHFPASNYLSICRRRLGFSWRFCAICYDNTPAQAEWAGKRAWASGCEDEENAWEQWLATSCTNGAICMDSWWRLGLHPFFAWYVIHHFGLNICLGHTQRNDVRSIHTCCTKGLEKFYVYVLIKWHLVLKCDLSPLAYSLSTTGYFLIPPKSIKTD